MERVLGRTPWTEDQVEFLRRNVGDMTMGQIASNLPPPYHSRNAVIGKANRLGLVGNPGNKVFSYANRKDASMRIGKRKAQQVQDSKSQVMKIQRRVETQLARTSMDERLGGMGWYKEVAAVEITLDHPDIETRPVSLIDRRSDQCCWPLDDGMFCGMPRCTPEFGKTEYCKRHHQQSVRPHSEYRKPLRRRT